MQIVQETNENCMSGNVKENSRKTKFDFIRNDNVRKEIKYKI